MCVVCVVAIATVPSIYHLVCLRKLMPKPPFAGQLSSNMMLHFARTGTQSLSWLFGADDDDEGQAQRDRNGTWNEQTETTHIHRLSADC